MHSLQEVVKSSKKLAALQTNNTKTAPARIQILLLNEVAENHY